MKLNQFIMLTVCRLTAYIVVIGLIVFIGTRFK